MCVSSPASEGAATRVSDAGSPGGDGNQEVIDAHHAVTVQILVTSTAVTKRRNK